MTSFSFLFRRKEKQKEAKRKEKPDKNNNNKIPTGTDNFIILKERVSRSFYYFSNSSYVVCSTSRMALSWLA